MNTQLENLLNLQEAAVILQLKTSTLKRMASSGEVPNMQLGRRRFFLKDQLAKYIFERSVKTN